MYRSCEIGPIKSIRNKNYYIKRFIGQWFIYLFQKTKDQILYDVTGSQEIVC